MIYEPIFADPSDAIMEVVKVRFQNVFKARPHPEDTPIKELQLSEIWEAIEQLNPLDQKGALNYILGGPSQNDYNSFLQLYHAVYHNPMARGHIGGEARQGSSTFEV